MSLINYIFILLFTISSAFGYDFKVRIQWDEMEGDAEGIIQYYHDGTVEAIRGSFNKSSSDANVTVTRNLSEGSQEIIINNSKGKLFNIWLINSFADEDIVNEDDFYVLSASNATVFIEDQVNQKNYEITLPPETKGLAFHACAISDGQFYNISEMYERLRLYKANLVNAVDGQPLSDVYIVFKNPKTGKIVTQGKSDLNGHFEQKFDYGNYEAHFTKPGFISTWHTFKMDLTELPVNMYFAMTPEIQEFRIVLTWGHFPADLDAHLGGPKPEGGKFHIWWSNKILISGKDFLDRDDQNAYGPETITIYKSAKGIYEYAVHNFTGKENLNSLDLSFSGAHIDVYGDGELKASFDASPGKRGTVWKVFQLDINQKIIPINFYYSQGLSANVLDTNH